MTDPRWTIDGDSQSLVWRDGNGGIADIAVWIIEGDPDQEAAFDALVAAVRDADTLRQARQWLAAAEDQDPATFAHSDLLADLKDLLSPPVSHDTPTPTGQT